MSDEPALFLSSSTDVRVVDLVRQLQGYSEISQFEGALAGTPALILGLGPSLGMLKNRKPTCPTFGVNAIFRHQIVPTFLVVHDTPHAFPPDKRTWVNLCPAKMFTKHPSWLNERENIVITPARRCAPSEIKDNEILQGVDGTFMALNLAAFMGASPIGLVGLDFTRHRALTRRAESLAVNYRNRVAYLAERGITVQNLSVGSELNKRSAVPFGSLDGYTVEE